MRVIAGTARSLALKTPVGIDTRPTTDRIKETLFNMLQPWLAGCVFADLYSGSGAIGIEALSRGAGKAYFVENQAQPYQCIQENLQFTRLAGQAVVLKQDAVAALSQIQEKQVDIFFLDPPYDQGEEKRVLSYLANAAYVTEETLIVVEAALYTDFSYVEELDLTVWKEKKYKTNKHIFIRKFS